MEGQEYLNQISASNRPAKASGGLSNLLSSKFFLVGVIGVVALIIIIIIGSLLSGGKSTPKELTASLKTHMDNTTEVIREYQIHVKSSSLRSSSASLASVLTDTSTKIGGYISATYGEVQLPETTVADLTLAKDTLKEELFEAKINGILDRIYAHKMAYEVSLFMMEEEQLSASSDETLTLILNDSHTSLENLYSNFNDFSETK